MGCAGQQRGEQGDYREHGGVSTMYLSLRHGMRRTAARREGGYREYGGVATTGRKHVIVGVGLARMIWV